jgi:acetoacetate decarboxylase
MDRATLRESAFAMPPTSPAFPPGPYRFVDRQYFIIRYRTDPEALRRVVPEPLEIVEPVVNYEFIRMPDSTGFGDYTESGQVIPVRYQGRTGSYTHQMFLNDHPPIAAGREIWGFPKKLAQPTLTVETNTLVGTLNYGSVRIAPARWATSTAPSTWRRRPKAWAHRTSCSRSSRMSMAARASASWWASISRT